MSLALLQVTLTHYGLILLKFQDPHSQLVQAHAFVLTLMRNYRGIVFREMNPHLVTKSIWNIIVYSACYYSCLNCDIYANNN